MECSVSKEIDYLNVLKEEVMAEYMKFQKGFHVDSPRKCFSLVSYLLKNGYFDYEKCSKRREEFDSDNQFFCLSALVLNNHGYCRHKAPFLTEILIKSGYSAACMTGYLSSCKSKKMFDPEDLKNYLNFMKYDEEKRENIYKFLSRFDKKAIGSSFPLDFIWYLLFGNHIITVSAKEEITYYLDLENDFILESNIDGLSGPYGVTFSPNKFMTNGMKKVYYPNGASVEELTQYDTEALIVSNLEHHFNQLGLYRRKEEFIQFHEEIQPHLMEAEKVMKQIFKS